MKNTKDITPSIQEATLLDIIKEGEAYAKLHNLNYFGAILTGKKNRDEFDDEDRSSDKPVFQLTEHHTEGFDPQNVGPLSIISYFIMSCIKSNNKKAVRDNLSMIFDVLYLAQENHDIGDGSDYKVIKKEDFEYQKKPLSRAGKMALVGLLVISAIVGFVIGLIL
jgi:hypothetical protein